MDHTLQMIGAAIRGFLEPHWRAWHALRGEAPAIPSAGVCGRSSLFLAQVLRRDLHLDARWRSGAPGEDADCGFFDGVEWRGHAWVESGGWLVDLTLDQFGGPPVLVTCADDNRYRAGRDVALPAFRAERRRTVQQLWPAWRLSPLRDSVGALAVLRRVKLADDATLQNTGAEFADAEVARCYLSRTPYPDALHARLLELAPRRTLALDLGCGPGKLAHALADGFAEVVAVDPSAPMIALGKAVDGGAHANIRWVVAAAETADLPFAIDLAVAGASLHWMTHAVLFPKLADALAPDGIIAAVDGDGPADAPWLADHQAVVVRWLEALGHAYGDPAFRARMSAHEAWIDIAGREVFEAVVRQPVEDLIAAEHSRATWTRAKMGSLAEAFDADLRAVLEPHAVNGIVEFTTRTRLAWGRPRRSPNS